VKKEQNTGVRKTQWWGNMVLFDLFAKLEEYDEGD
jgi:hypothetical protein